MAKGKQKALQNRLKNIREDKKKDLAMGVQKLSVAGSSYLYGMLEKQNKLPNVKGIDPSLIGVGLGIASMFVAKKKPVAFAAVSGATDSLLSIATYKLAKGEPIVNKVGETDYLLPGTEQTVFVGGMTDDENEIDTDTEIVEFNK